MILLKRCMLLKIAPLVVVFISFYAFKRVFLLLSYYYVVILSLILAGETKITLKNKIE